MKPQLAMNSVRWTRYLSFFSIYRHILNIRTIYVRIRTIYKHIRLSKILYVCVRIRTYIVRILRLYTSYTYVYLVPKPVGMTIQTYTDLYRCIQTYTNELYVRIHAYTCNIRTYSDGKNRSSLQVLEQSDNRIWSYMYVYCSYFLSIYW